jgi:hypothetical protein
LDREQAKLVGPFGSTTRANARLLALTRAGLLRRTLVGTINGGRKAVYSPAGRRRALVHHRPTAAGFLQHQLAVADVYHAFRSTSSELIEWQSFSAPLLPGSRLIPDGLIRTTADDQPRAIFVEADQGTESLSVWRQKAAKYVELALSGLHEGITGSATFQVVVTAPSERRARSIGRAVQEVTSKLFWITWQGSLKQASPWQPIWLRPGRDELTYLL